MVIPYAIAHQFPWTKCENTGHLSFLNYRSCTGKEFLKLLMGMKISQEKNDRE